MNGFLILSAVGTDLSDGTTPIKLLPLGPVTSQKGNFVVDEESLRLMKEQIQRRGVDVVIDYEHQTLKDVEAPAGGWIKDIYIEGAAIMAAVEWTPRAAEYIANKEYRYLSPVVMVRKSDGKAINLHSAALTNTPAIHNMFPLVNSYDPTFEGGNSEMDEFMKALIQLLGLGEDATPESILKALAEKLQEQPPAAGGEEIVANKTICDLLGVPPTAKTEDVAAAIVALKAPAQELATQFVALKEKLERQEADSAVEAAMQAGKIAPAMKDWATAYALKDPSGFAGFVEKAPVVVPLGELSHSPALERSSDRLDDTALAICKQMGLDPEDIKTYGKDDR